MPAAFPMRLHATAIAMDGAAAAIRGPSGAGKSDLALRCLALPVGGLTPSAIELVADDYCELFVDTAQPDLLKVRAPESIAGMIEVRGLGVIRLASVPSASLRLIVDLCAAETIERLPDAPSAEIAGFRLPLLRLDPFEAAAPLKLSLALREAAAARTDAGG